MFLKLEIYALCIWNLGKENPSSVCAFTLLSGIRWVRILCTNLNKALGNCEVQRNWCSLHYPTSGTAHNVSINRHTLKRYFIFGTTAPIGPGTPHSQIFLDHTQTHYIRLDSSVRVISPSERPRPENTQHSQHTDIHDPVGIRTHNLSRRTTTDLRLGARGDWHRLSTTE